MIGGLDMGGVGILAAAGAVVLFAIGYALLRGDRGDPLERLAAWAQTRGLDYVAPESDQLLATFVGDVEGGHVEVVVSRAARGFGVDLPSTVTTMTVGHSDGDAVCVVQPATWVLDRDGHHVGEATRTGDAAFDARWSVRAEDVDAATRYLSPNVRLRLLKPYAEGLVIEITAHSIAIPMPGVCADPRELNRRLDLVLALSAASKS